MLFERACARGQMRACSNLGVMLRRGQGITHDDARAAGLFERACAGRYAPGCFNLGLVAESAGETTRARELFRNACSAGYDAGCRKLAASSGVQVPLSASQDFEPSASRRQPTCSIFAPDPWPEDCSTPRTGVVSGGFFGFDVGYVAPHKAPGRRISAGEGYSLSARFGIELWDQLLFTLSLGSIHLKDYAPTSESVITCHTFQGATLSCDDDPHELESVLKGGFASYELGYQYRFRVARWMSIAPAALFGYMNMFHGIKRVVECKDCPGGTRVPIDLDGPYAMGLVRITFSRSGLVSAMVRSQWFLSGDMRHLTAFGVEIIAP